MTYFHFSKIAIVFCFGLLFFRPPFSAGQNIPVARVAENAFEPEPSNPLTIKLSVEEVRIDVVVLDKKRNPITDLTAADFEVYQDNKRQEILASVYVDSQFDAAPRPAAPRPAAPRSSADRKAAQNLPLFPLPALKKKEDVRRTIVFLVDDHSMSFENGYYTKMALRNFVEKQMQPGDMVSILRTDYGNRALNMFFFDKREALARINALPPTMARQPLDSGLGAVVSSRAMLARIKEMQADFDRRNIKNLVSHLSYSIRTLRNMPGRKIINTTTNVLTYCDRGDECISERSSLLKLADEALRAGVVINFLGISGLENFREHGADASVPGRISYNLLSRDEIMSQDRRTVTKAEQALNFEQMNYQALIQSEQSKRFSRPLNPLPDLTGGVFIKDSNFFLDGIGKETESLMRGYYLISYAPPPDTFKTRGLKDDGYRRLKVRVKRKDAVVHSRDGFFGRLESEPTADAPEQHPLIEAIYSPYQYDGLNVDVAAGYVKGAETGYLLRSWIHLDPKDVKIVETEDGAARIDLEAVCLTSDINGNIQDSKRVEFTLSKFNIDWIKKHGIRFSMALPVKKPGTYYVRVSVRDKESGKVGSAYQFLEIPDLKKKRPALSNIFMITSAEDLQWMYSGEASEGMFFPSFQSEEIRSPAIRTYRRGDKLQALAMLYNTDAKAIARSEMEAQTILYKDGKEFMRGAPSPVASDKAEDTGGIPLLNVFTVGANMTPGNYVLQILVTDRNNSKNEEGANYQTIGFTVTEK